MSEQDGRTLVGDAPRCATEREWELFVRDDGATPLKHVGSVTAPSAEVAHELAADLFGWEATDVWLCPASSVHRYSTNSLAADATGGESAAAEESNTPSDAAAGEQRRRADD
jgi:rSAM-partnered protein